MLLGMLVFGGCSQPKGVIFEPINPPLNWPASSQITRIHYVGELRTDKDLKPARSFVKELGETLFGANPSRSMLTPYAVCSDDRDRIFVCDSNAQLVHVFDLEKRTYERWKPGEQDPPFAQPVGIACDELGQIYVSDSAAGEIFIFDPSGTPLGRVGKDVLSKPSGLAIDRSTHRLFVADVGTHQVMVFSLDGKLIERIGRRGTALGEFNFPTNVAIGSDGSLYVSDTLNFRIQVFNPDLRPVRQIGQKGDLPGYFSHPKGIALDSEDHLYVVDSHFESVQIFETQGSLLLTFGSEGSAPGEFWLPTGIHIDGSDRIWIADSYNQRLQVFQYRPEAQQ